MTCNIATPTAIPAHVGDVPEVVHGGWRGNGTGIRHVHDVLSYFVTRPPRVSAVALTLGLRLHHVSDVISHSATGNLPT